MAKKEQNKKAFAISYETKNGLVCNVKIKVNPLNMKSLLSVAEMLATQIIHIDEENKQLKEEIVAIRQKMIAMDNNISQLNGYALKHETELFQKHWWKKFLGL